jgi:guanosine-3',5'-bis(diphosphate) 3'-pyrophosphohydrolase
MIFRYQTESHNPIQNLRHKATKMNKPSSTYDIGLILKALAFAAHKHRDQKRKDLEASPYIKHPIALADVLCNEGGILDENVLCAALLHDTVEDTETTPDELTEVFGKVISNLVMELTDDKTLPKAAETEVLLKHGIIPRSEYDALLEQVRSQEIQLATANDDLAGTIKKADATNRQIARIESENATAKYDELMRSVENRTIKAPLTGVISQAYNLHAMVIPLPYVRRENGASFTWVKVQDGSIQRRLIELGRTTETGIEVLKGLRVGEQVVLRDKSEA